MKKLLAILLVVAFIFTLSVPTLAEPNENSYHCNAFGGNGRVWPTEFDGEDAICPKCGSSEWVKFDSGNGEQYKHPVEEVEDYILYRYEEEVDNGITEFFVSDVYTNKITNINTLYITVTENGTKTITTYAVWASGNVTTENIRTEDYNNDISVTKVVPNGSEEVTVDVGIYTVWVKIRGNDTIVDWKFI